MACVSKFLWVTQGEAPLRSSGASPCVTQRNLLTQANAPGALASPSQPITALDFNHPAFPLDRSGPCTQKDACNELFTRGQRDTVLALIKCPEFTPSQRNKLHSHQPPPRHVNQTFTSIPAQTSWRRCVLSHNSPPANREPRSRSSDHQQNVNKEAMQTQAWEEGARRNI